MRARAATAAMFTAAALAMAPMTAAVAEDAPVKPAMTKSAEARAKSAEARAKAKAKKEARRLERALGGNKRTVVLGGTLVSVAPEDPVVEDDASSLTLTVHGGRFKLLRGTEFTVTVGEGAKVTREGLAELGDLLAGDHVVVKLRGLDLKVVKDDEGQWVMEGTAAAVRVVASPADDAGEDTAAPTS